MTYGAFLRMQKLTGKAIIVVAAKHNHREILAELGGTPGCSIDPSRTSLNHVLRGADTAAGVATQAQALMSAAGVNKLRKDAVRALEIIVSLPTDSQVDQLAFFNDATRWVEMTMGAPVISAIVHNDEAAPHAHILILPLINGRMVGSDLMGNRAKLQTLQSDFYVKVGQRYGLSRQLAPARLSAAQRRQAIDSAFAALEANSGLQSSLLHVLLEPHRSNPEPLLKALGIAVPAPRGKAKGSFAAMMTRPCKPESKPIGIARRKPIGFDVVASGENEQTLSCVGFADSTPPIPCDFEQHDGIADQRQPPDSNVLSSEHVSTPTLSAIPTAADGPAPDTGDNYKRQRDDDRPAEQWDSDRGEFVSQPHGGQLAHRAQAALATPPGTQGARASPVSIALSIHPLLALASFNEQAPTTGQKVRP